jgi:hypothetical protein
MNSTPTVGRTRISFPVAPNSLFPTPAVEEIAGIPLGADQFSVEEVPLFARAIAKDDTVLARFDHAGIMRFVEQTGTARHSVYRVRVLLSGALDRIRDEISALGLGVRPRPDLSLLAIDVPEVDMLQALQRFLQAERSSGAVEYEQAQMPMTVPSGVEREYRYFGMDEGDPYVTWRKARIPEYGSSEELYELNGEIMYADTMVAGLLVPLVNRGERSSPIPGFRQVLLNLVESASRIAESVDRDMAMLASNNLRYCELMLAVFDNYGFE